MRWVVPLVVALMLLVAAVPSVQLDAGAQPAPAGLAASLRYVGRDPATGMPEQIAERGIFEIEQAYEQYNEETREPVPPPPAAGVNIASVRVEAIGIEARVARYGLDRAGRLDVPQDAVTVGWHPAYSALPGGGGATFLAAHYVYGSQVGVFYELSSLTPGAVVSVVMTDGSEHRYRVTSVQDYPLASIDMGAILQGREGRESLTVMTCSGPSDGQTFAFRTVVLAERVEGA